MAVYREEIQYFSKSNIFVAKNRQNEIIGTIRITPSGVVERYFHKQIREWVRLEDSLGPEALRHQNSNKIWNPEEKLKLVSQVIAGKSLREVAYSVGVNNSVLYQWVQKYKSLGYNGLINIKKGRPAKDSEMKKKKINTNKPKKLTESEREELIRLRAENEYIKAENEAIKKEIALREEKQAALLKAKKQQLSKNSVKKDIN